MKQGLVINPTQNEAGYFPKTIIIEALAQGDLKRSSAQCLMSEHEELKHGQKYETGKVHFICGPSSL